MSVTQLNPYLNFDGTAGQAIALYERALGAKTENVMRFGDTPGMEAQAQHKDRVMHATLQVGAGVVMISDSLPDQAVIGGNTVHVCLNFDDLDDMTTKFNALAAGGTITMPLQDTFWGARFGMLTDAFGIHWMFNGTLPKQS